MAARHHEVSPQEETAERRRVSAEADVAEAVAELVSGVDTRSTCWSTIPPPA